MRRSLSVAFLTIILLSNSLAVLRSGEKPLTLKECISIALERNFQILAANYDVESKRLSVIQSFGSFLPSLSSSAGWNRSQSQGGTMTFGGIELPLPLSISNSFSVSVGAGITLFDGFASFNNLEGAKANALASEYTLNRTKQSIVVTVYAYYFNVLRTKALFKLSQDNIKYSQSLLDKIRESEKLGAAAQASVYQQQAQVAMDELTLTNAENAYNKARSDLAAFLSLNVSEDFQFEDAAVKTDLDSNEYTSLRDKLNNFQSLVTKAFESRPDYKSSLENLNASQATLSSTKSSYFPSISGNFSWGVGSSKVDKLFDNNRYGWGISISFPIFQRFSSGFLFNNRVDQAELSLKTTNEQIKEKERTIQVDIKKAILDLDAAYKSYESAKKSAAFQMENMRISQEKYNLGSTTLLDLLFAQNNFNNSETSKVNATYQYLTAIKQVEYALGTLSN